MKTLSFAVSGVRSVFAKFVLCLIPLFLISAPASASSVSLGSVSNPLIAGGTLSTVNNVGMINSTLGFNLDIKDIGGPAQVFLVGYVPAGSLGLTTGGWFVFTQDNGWQPAGSTIAPAVTGVPVGTTLRISLVSGVDINSLPKLEVYVGYGTSADEMVKSTRFKAVLAVR